MMNSSVEIKDREKIAKEIVKTSESIRKKYRALKTGRLEEDVALKRHFKPIIESLKQIAGSSANVESNVDVKTEKPWMSTSVETKSVILKPKGTMKRKTIAPIALTPPKRKLLDDPPIVPTSTGALQYEQLLGMSHESSPIDNLPTDDDDDNENVFETPDEPLAPSVRRQLQTFEGQQTLRDHFGPLGQKYMGAVLSSEKDNTIDYVYGVRLSNDGAVLGDKHIDMDRDDNIIIDETRYMGTPGLYELIFKRIPDDAVYTEVDMRKYRSILLATNAHRRGYLPQNPILGNRGHKYKHVIAPLVSRVSSNKVAGKGLSVSPAMMTLNDNNIDYVHWDDPNELVDRLRLLEASHQAGNNAHDNEILSIIEELREAGLIIN